MAGKEKENVTNEKEEKDDNEDLLKELHLYHAESKIRELAEQLYGPEKVDRREEEDMATKEQPEATNLEEIKYPERSVIVDEDPFKSITEHFAFGEDEHLESKDFGLQIGQLHPSHEQHVIHTELNTLRKLQEKWREAD